MKFLFGSYILLSIFHVVESYQSRSQKCTYKNQFVSSLLGASQLCPWSPIVSLFVEKSSGKVVMDVCGARVEEG